MQLSHSISSEIRKHPHRSRTSTQHAKKFHRHLNSMSAQTIKHKEEEASKHSKASISWK